MKLLSRRSTLWTRGSPAGGGGGCAGRWSARCRRRLGARAGSCSAGGGTSRLCSTRARSTAARMTPEGRSPSRYSTPRSPWSTSFWFYKVRSTWKCRAILVTRPSICMVSTLFLHKHRAKEVAISDPRWIGSVGLLME
ncbi:unnamed protein product [Linum trigynum]|uniref:Uncharacterized protein n=1 Tax=Linum trigynum TaxID=586398 RepID=A0AAV2FBR5_9ROSI